MDTRYDKLLMEQNIQPYSGFLNIYKEKGYTSMDVCAKLRGILGMRKIGHAGTLDPMAEGTGSETARRPTGQACFWEG